MTGIPWLLQKFSRPSQKNGTIDIRQEFGRWSVVVGGCEQTTPYTHAMWTDALSRVSEMRRSLPTKKVLMLGLAAGGELKGLYKKFPACSIVAVEYDPAMIALTHELGLYKPYPLPRIVQGDAAKVVPALEEQFDLVMVDLFLGEEPSPLITQDFFIKALQSRLGPGGHLLVNVYKRAEYLKPLAATFASGQQWVYKCNTLGLFSEPKTY